jgi:dephospho-CoA kinase
MATKLIAIAGGIGSGKSVVSTVLRLMGRKVYDCDSRAKQLMDTSDSIKRELVEQIGADTVDSNGCIDRRRISAIVFNDAAKLRALNGIVHKAVRADLLQWRDSHSDTVWVECAIIYDSGLDKIVDEVWQVDAPIEMRVERVMQRNGLSRDEVLARIQSQSRGVAEPHKRVYEILNDEVTPMLPQILHLLQNQP